jgi:hypothetical protein
VKNPWAEWGKKKRGGRMIKGRIMALNGARRKKEEGWSREENPWNEGAGRKGEEGWAVWKTLAKNDWKGDLQQMVLSQKVKEWRMLWVGESLYRKWYRSRGSDGWVGQSG